MNNYSYNATTYPYESGQYSERLKLPYGKVFDLPTYNTNSDTAFKAIWLKNGNVTVEIDASTGGVINANYAYDYTVDIINKQKIFLGVLFIVCNLKTLSCQKQLKNL